MRPFPALSALILLAACNSTEIPLSNSNTSQDTSTKSAPSKQPAAVTQKKLGLYTLQSDSVLVPPFQIEIALSPKAAEKIGSSKETLIVDVFLQGEPKDPSTARVADDGTFYVGEAKREIQPGQKARFDDLKFSKVLYDQLADKDAELSVNVYTGRRSSPDNLIECEFLSKKISEVANQQFTLKAKLIWGDE